MGMFDFLSKEPKRKSKLSSQPSAKHNEKVDDIPSFDFDTEGADDELPVFPSMDEMDHEEVEDLEDYRKHIKDVEVEELSDREDLSLTKPIFMSVHLYKELIDELGQMKDRFSEAGTTIENIEKINDDNERYYNRWKRQIEELHNKLIYEYIKNYLEIK